MGRIDNIINSGGIKLNPEYIEQKLSPVISNRFIIVQNPIKTRITSYSGYRVRF